MDTSTPPVCQQDVTGGMGIYFDKIQMLGKKGGGCCFQRREHWCWARVHTESTSLRSKVSRGNVTLLLILILFSEFVGRDRPRQLALNGSTTEYHLKNVAHDTEYVLTLYVLFGSVVGPGITATFRTCEYQYTLYLQPTRGTTEFQERLEWMMPSQNVMMHWWSSVSHFSGVSVWLTSHVSVLITVPVPVTCSICQWAWIRRAASWSLKGFYFDSAYFSFPTVAQNSSSSTKHCTLFIHKISITQRSSVIWVQRGHFGERNI